MALLRVVVIGGSVLVWRRLDTTLAAYVLIEVLNALWLQLSASRAFRAAFGSAWWRTPAPTLPPTSMIRLVAIGTVIDTLKAFAGRAVCRLAVRQPLRVANTRPRQLLESRSG